VAEKEADKDEANDDSRSTWETHKHPVKPKPRRHILKNPRFPITVINIVFIVIILKICRQQKRVRVKYGHSDRLPLPLPPVAETCRKYLGPMFLLSCARVHTGPETSAHKKTGSAHKCSLQKCVSNIFHALHSKFR